MLSSSAAAAFMEMEKIGAVRLLTICTLLLLPKQCLGQKFVVIVDFEPEDLEKFLVREHYMYIKKHNVQLLTLHKTSDEYEIIEQVKAIKQPYFLLVLSRFIDCESMEVLINVANVTVTSDSCAFHGNEGLIRLNQLNPDGHLVTTFLSSLFSSFKRNSFSIFYTAVPTYRFYAIGLIADILIKSDIRLTDFGNVFELIQRRGSSGFDSKVFLYVCDDHDLRSIFSPLNGFKCNSDELHIIVNTDQLYLPESDYSKKCSSIVQMFAFDELNDPDNLLDIFTSIFVQNEAYKNLSLSTRRSMFHLLAFLSHYEQKTEYITKPVYSKYINASYNNNSFRMFNMIIGSKPNYSTDLISFFRTIHGIPWRMNQDLWTPPAPEHIYKTCADLRILLWGMLAIFATIALVCVGIYVIRNNFLKRQMIRGPNRILLLPEDLIFVRPKRSIFSNEEKSVNKGVSRSSDANSFGSLITLKSNALKSGKTATFNGDTVWVKRLKMPNFTLKGKIIKEFRVVSMGRTENK